MAGIPTRPVSGAPVASVWGQNVHDTVFGALQRVEIAGPVTVPSAGASAEAGRITITPAFDGQRWMVVYGCSVIVNQIGTVSSRLVLPAMSPAIPGGNRWNQDVVKAANDRSPLGMTALWVAPAGSAGVAQPVIAYVSHTVAGAQLSTIIAGAWWLEAIPL